MCLSVLGLVVYGGLLLVGGFCGGVLLLALLAVAQRAEIERRRETVGPRRRRPWEG